MFWHNIAYFFTVGLVTTKFKEPTSKFCITKKFCIFQPALQNLKYKHKFAGRKLLLKGFSGKFRKISGKVYFATQNISCSYTYGAFVHNFW